MWLLKCLFLSALAWKWHWIEILLPFDWEGDFWYPRAKILLMDNGGAKM